MAYTKGHSDPYVFWKSSCPVYADKKLDQYNTKTKLRLVQVYEYCRQTRANEPTIFKLSETPPTSYSTQKKTDHEIVDILFKYNYDINNNTYEVCDGNWDVFFHVFLQYLTFLSTYQHAIINMIIIFK